MRKKKNRVLPVIIVFLLTILSLGAGCAEGNQARLDELQQEVTSLRTEKETLQGQITALETEAAELRQGQEIKRIPKDGWEQYFPEGAESTLKGESTARVRELLGEPPFLIRSIAVNPEFSREIWIFTPFDQDPTGLYLFFKGGKLDSAELNEFNGLPGSDLLNRPGFWTQ
ncbi:MAG: hypothetical protein KGZ54_00050 [Dethiobacter sp.]|nr:hypothetical protein [Dethiobacter sp.]MBS3990156.1 hypothetical protein [Dethiobacter sp.]